MFNYRKDIDGLRAIAILGVVVNHFFSKFLPGGFSGVDVFFVISGYLITSIILLKHKEKNFSFLSFYIRRIKRLFPALIFVFFVSIIIGWFILFPFEFVNLARHIKEAIVFSINFQLINEVGYFDTSKFSKPMLHLWSLSVEEQFYFIWPLIILFIYKNKNSLLLVSFLFLLASFTFSFFYFSSNPDAFYYHPFVRFWELLVGALISIFLIRSKKATYFANSYLYNLFYKFLSLFGFILILISYFLLDNTKYSSLYLLFPVIGTSLIIAFPVQSKINNLLSSRILVFIGLVSYPLYLWHWPIYSFLNILDSGNPSSLFLCLGLFLAFILSIFTYRFIEIPLKNLNIKSGYLAILLVIFISIIYFLAKDIRNQNGYPDRDNLEFLNVYSDQLDRQAAIDNDCKNLFSDTLITSYCRYSNVGKNNTVVLIGDSHAHVLFPGLANLLKNEGINLLLLANSGCPPLIDTVIGRTNQEKTDCKNNITNIYNKIASLKNISSVIFATRGPQYLFGTGFGPVERNYNKPPVSNLTNESLSGEDAFSYGLSLSIDKIRSLNIDSIFYFLQVPELGINVVNCLGRPFYLSNKKFGCKVNYDVYQERMSIYRNIVKKLAIEKNFQVIDPEIVFCNSSHCDGTIGNSLLYADDNHLSINGSSLVAPLIYDKLKIDKQE